MDRKEAMERMIGPVPSISIPFTQDGEVDYRGLADFVEFLVANKTSTLLITLADSLFSILSDAEIEEITRVVTRQNRGRAMVVAGTQRWWTQKTVAFVRFARECGADMVITAPADWAQNNNDDLLLAHYKAVAQELPIMLMTALGKRPVPLNVIEETVNTVPGLIAIKDDICGHYGQHVATVARKGGVTLLSGGRMENHLEVYPYGSNSWLSIVMRFMPRIAWGYWEAVQAGNMPLAAGYVECFERPYFEDLTKELNLEFDAVIHASMEIKGICKRYRRAPYPDANEKQMERIRAVLDSFEKLLDEGVSA